jgi:protein-S-isoprenylcysteine O-methyltransferase Ste14
VRREPAGHRGNAQLNSPARTVEVHHRPAPASLLLVALQIGTLAWLALTAPVWRSGPLPFAAQMAGLAVIGWAALTVRHFRVVPEIHRRATLCVSGPYRWVRHPMYTGVLLLSAAWTAAAPRPDRCAAFAVLVGVLWIKARREERLLATRFQEYSAYAARTWRFVPRIGRS